MIVDSIEGFVKRMKEKEEIDIEALKLQVYQSSIGSVGSGIARMNSIHLEIFGDDPPQLVLVRSEEKEKTVKLVSDRLAEKGKIILRKDDMVDLNLKDGDEVEILPYTKLSDDLKNKWDHFKERFRKDDEEEEEEK